MKLGHKAGFFLPCVSLFLPLVFLGEFFPPPLTYVMICVLGRQMGGVPSIIRRGGIGLFLRIVGDLRLRSSDERVVVFFNSGFCFDLRCFFFFSRGK